MNKKVAALLLSGMTLISAQQLQLVNKTMVIKELNKDIYKQSMENDYLGQSNEILEEINKIQDVMIGKLETNNELLHSLREQEKKKSNTVVLTPQGYYNLGALDLYLMETNGIMKLYILKQMLPNQINQSFLNQFGITKIEEIQQDESIETFLIPTSANQMVRTNVLPILTDAQTGELVMPLIKQSEGKIVPASTFVGTDFTNMVGKVITLERLENEIQKNYLQFLENAKPRNNKHV